ncbi:hypothetical protein [Clostridium felsineum]|nr:hypothetical protein [Clostridium felsineum]
MEKVNNLKGGYSYDNGDVDTNLNNFSIDKDKKYLIQAVKRA